MLTELRGAHQKYKYIEAELVQRKRRLAFKQPEIRKCLDAVTLLLARREAGEAVREGALCMEGARGVGGGCSRSAAC